MSKVEQQTQVVYIQDHGCCGLRGRVQWVAGYNLVVGFFGLLGGGINLANSALDSMPELRSASIIQLVGAIFLVVGGICLLVAVSQRNPQLLIGWFVCIGFYMVMALTTLGLSAAVLVAVAATTTGSATTIFATAAAIQLAGSVIFILIQVACIVTVVKYKRNVY